MGAGLHMVKVWELLLPMLQFHGFLAMICVFTFCISEMGISVFAPDDICSELFLPEKKLELNGSSVSQDVYNLILAFHLAFVLC